MNNFLKHISFFAPLILVWGKSCGYGITIFFFNIKKSYSKFRVLKQWALFSLKYVHNNDIYFEVILFGITLRIFIKRSDNLKDYIGI